MRKKEAIKHDEEFFRWVSELVRDRGVHPAKIAMETGASIFTVLRWGQRAQGRVNPQYRRIVGEMYAAAGGAPTENGKAVVMEEESHGCQNPDS